MVIKILGTGCPKCNKLEALAKEAAKELGVTAHIQKITNIIEISKSGILRPQGLIINGVIISQGKVPSLEELKQSIQDTVQ